jgi:hypothetical protein
VGSFSAREGASRDLDRLDETRKKQIERLSERFSGLFTRHSEVVSIFGRFRSVKSFKMMKMNSSPAKPTDSTRH